MTTSNPYSNLSPSLNESPKHSNPDTASLLKSFLFQLEEIRITDPERYRAYIRRLFKSLS